MGVIHGISINVDPDLDHFEGIVPCGITEYGVTSLVDLGLPVSMFDLDVALKQSFCVFESILQTLRKCVLKEPNKINLIALKFKKRNFSWHAANTAIAC